MDSKLVVARCFGGDLQKGRYIGDLACYPFGGGEHFKGVATVALERSSFRAEGADSEEMWLEPFLSADASLAQKGIARFTVEFIGRRSLCPARFGHMGMWPNEVIVEKMISKRELP